MPTFDVLTLSSPAGFQQACITLNELVEENESYFQELVYSARKTMAGGTRGKVKGAALETVLLAVSFLGRALHSASPTVGMKEAASVLDSNTLLSRPAIELFLVAWKDCDKEITEATKEEGNFSLELDRIRQGGALFDLKWKIGSIMDASTISGSENLCCPYVELSFKVRHLDGDVDSHVFQLSYHEFQDFYVQVKEAAAVMDAV